MLEEMTLKDLNKLISILNKENTLPEIIQNGEEIRIIILQRGWIIIGKYYQQGSQCWIDSGYVIREWGTTKGLGQLALEGTQPNTKLDAVSCVKFHELTVVASMICDPNKWVGKF